MTSAHIFFIPGMILIGVFLGVIIGSRAARNQMDIQRKRDEEREVARAARAARREAKAAEAPAEAKSPEVVSEEKSAGTVPEEKPAVDEKPTKKVGKGKSR